MKIVLSRKGCDSAAGKLANVLLPNGAMMMLPIPEGRASSHPRTYQEINAGDQSLGLLIHDLSKGKIMPDTVAHLDPDLDKESVPRAPGWKPLFGQSGIAERHLQRMGIGPGDLFVFGVGSARLSYIMDDSATCPPTTAYMRSLAGCRWSNEST